MQRLVSILHILSGLVCGAIALPFIQLLLFDPGTSPSLKADGQVFLLWSILFFGPSLLVGALGLIHFRSARWPLFALGSIYLALFPLGTLLGAFTLIVTLRPALPGAINRKEANRISGILLAMGVVGSGFILGLALLFAVNDNKAPEELAMLAWPAGLAFPVCLVLLFRRIAWSFWSVSPIAARRRWHREDAQRRREEDARVAQLLKDPQTRLYGEAIRRGEYWSDQAIAYDRDPDMLATAPALRPIEAAMRRAGIPTRFEFPGIVTARCRIDADRLATLFPADGTYVYSDTYTFERGYDPFEAVIITADGVSYIHVVHPNAPDSVPTFPTPTAG